MTTGCFAIKHPVLRIGMCRGLAFTRSSAFLTIICCLFKRQFYTQFGIKHNRYAFCCVALVGEKAISLPVQSCSGCMVSYPELANQPFRRSHFHRSEDAPSKSW